MSPKHLAAAALTTILSAHAQDPQRGAELYRALPGQPGVGSCISCHGEPINNRNSVLRGAVGGGLISRTIAAVGAMGYLRQYLNDADLADIAAYLATVVPAGAVDELPAPWPTSDDFGHWPVGSQAVERVLLIRNLLPTTAVAIGSVVSDDPLRFPVTHDCPISLPPLGQCRARAWFRPQTEGAVSAGYSIVDTSGRVLRGGLLFGTGSAGMPPRLAWDAAPELVDFARVTVGQAAERTLTLLNPGPGAVTLERLRITGPNASRFTLAAPCGSARRIEANQRCAVTIGFAPASADRAEGWVELVSDAANAPLVRVQAIGVAPPPPPPQPPVQPPAGGGGGTTSLPWLLALAAAVARLRGRR